MHFHCQVWHRALSLPYVCIRSFGIIIVLHATFVPNFVSFAACIAELAHGEKSRTLSPSLFDAPGTEAFASENFTPRYSCMQSRYAGWFLTYRLLAIDAEKQQELQNDEKRPAPFADHGH